MSIVLGIDFSSLAIDIVGIQEDDLEPPTWTRYTLEGQDAFDRTRTIGQHLPPRSSSAYDNVIAIGIEHPAGKFGTGPMMRVQGAVLACLPAGVLVQPWPPAAWRKAVGLPGNASKAYVSSFVFSRGDYPLHPVDFEVDSWPQDACDAYCIALATREALERQAAA